MQIYPHFVIDANNRKIISEIKIYPAYTLKDVCVLSMFSLTVFSLTRIQAGKDAWRL